MIEFASKDDFKEIVKLWNTCFGDSETYIKRFLNTLFTNTNCLVYKEDSSIVAMLFLLESKIVSSSSTQASYYVYAACTAPKNRGKGIMSTLLEHTIDYAAREKKDFLCLAPADEYLFEYYSRFGFKKIFKRKEFILNRNIMNQLSENGAETCVPSIKEIKLLRDKTLSTGNYLLWEEDIIRYAIDENERSGGKNLFIQQNEELVGYAVYSVEDNTVVIKELCVYKHCFALLTKALINQTEAEDFQFSLPLGFPLSVDNSTVRDNGMILPLNSVATTVLETMFHAFIGFTLE